MGQFYGNFDERGPVEAVAITETIRKITNQILLYVIREMVMS